MRDAFVANSLSSEEEHGYAGRAEPWAAGLGLFMMTGLKQGRTFVFDLRNPSRPGLGPGLGNR